MIIAIGIDLQNDFFYGALKNEMAIQIKGNIRKTSIDLIEKGAKLYFTKDTHYLNYKETLEGSTIPSHCIKGTNGWELIDEVKEFSDDKNIIEKNTFGYINWADVLGNLNSKTDEIVIFGVCTDICVISNSLILRALYPNVRITIIANSCAGLSNESHEAALLTAKMNQIDIK